MIDDENRMVLFNPEWLKNRKVQVASGAVLLALLVYILSLHGTSEPTPLTDEEIQTMGDVLRKAPSASERKDAAGALGRTGDGRAVPLLIQGLKDEDQYVQAASRGALVQIGEPAIAPLLEELKSEFADVRNLAVTALMDITGQYFGSDYAAWSEWTVTGSSAEPTAEQKETVEQIRKLLSGHQDWAYEALNELKKKKSEAAYRAVIEALDSSHREIPKLAISALAEMGGDQAVNALIRVYRRTDPYLMPELERAFLTMGMKGVEGLCVLLGDREHKNVPQYAGQTLAKRLDADFKGSYAEKRKEWSRISEKSAEQIIQLLEYEREGVRAFAAEILGRTGKDTAVTPLLACFEREYPKQTSRSGPFIGKDFEFELIRSLGNLGSRKASDILNTMLREEKKKKKRYNVPSFRQIVLSFAVSEVDRDTNALDYLVETLERGMTRSGGRGQSEWAAYLLVESTLDVSRPVCRSLEHRDDTVRGLAAWVLGLRGGEDVVPSLVRALGDEDRFVRRRVVDALGMVRNTDGLDAVAAVLEHDKEWIVRQAACRALGTSGDRKYTGTLINALNDEKFDVQSTAYYMLKQLTGQNFRSQSYDTWKKWYIRTQEK